MARDEVLEKAEAPSKAHDLYSWARRQAELLRAGRLSEILDTRRSRRRSTTWATNNTTSWKARYAW